MKLDCVYIETGDFDKSVDFYQKVLKTKPNVFSEGRWVEFDLDGGRISLYNRKYDAEKIPGAVTNKNYSQAYIDNFKQSNNKQHINNVVTFNFYTDNLKETYEYIKALKLKDVSNIMYVNITTPYYYFTVCDPDGNMLEIYGNNMN